MSKIIIVKNSERITIPVLNKYEFVNALGTRASQIARGAKIMLANAEEIKKIKAPVEIAEIEILKTRSCPLIIVRPLPNNREEHWDINELELLPSYD